MRIGIGIGIGIDRSSSQSGSSYWTPPTLLTATVYDEYQINLLWLGIDDASIERSNDNITFAEIGTVLSQSVYYDRTCTPNTLYYYRIRFYNGIKYTAYSNTASATTLNYWYLPTGIDASGLVGAWKAVGAASKAASLVNLVTPGTGDLIETGAVTWSKSVGWNRWATTKYLTGPTYKTKTYSVVILVRNTNDIVDYARAFSAERDDSGNYDTFIMPNAEGTIGYIRQANYAPASFTKVINGVLGSSQTKAFIDGASAGAIVPTGVETNITFRLGLDRQTIGLVFGGDILALAVYNTSISDAQMIEVQNTMKADNFIIRERDFSGLARYVNNPVIVHNTESWNIYGSDAPYIRSAQKIGKIWYAPSQVAVTNGNWNDIALYKTTNLINWYKTGSNPIISAVPNTWEHGYVLHPSVIKIGSTWNMYYSAWNKANKGQIGLATSSDLINWTKYVSNPVYTVADSAGLPCVILIGSTYYMYYHNGVYANNTGLIHYATSPDGLTWTYGGVCFTCTGYLVDYGIIDPWVIQRPDGIFEMVFSRVKWQPSITQDIGYAVSFDGITWQVHQGIVLDKGVASWEDDYVGDPILIDNPITGKGNLFYAGITSGGGATPGSDGGLAIL